MKFFGCVIFLLASLACAQLVQKKAPTAADTINLGTLLIGEVRIEAPTGNVATDRIGAVVITAKDKELTPHVAQLGIRIEVHGMALRRIAVEQFLHLRAPRIVVVVAFRLMADKDDTSFRRMTVQ